MVEEPTFKEAQEILSGVREVYTKHHKLAIPDAVVDESIRMSQRYIGDRFLPDKAIDLLDEAAASFRLNCTRAKNEIEKLKSIATEVKKVLGDKITDGDESKLDEGTRGKIQAFNEQFDELYALWKERVK